MPLGVFTRAVIAASVWWLCLSVPYFALNEARSFDRREDTLFDACIAMPHAPGVNVMDSCFRETSRRRDAFRAESPSRWVDSFGFALMLNIVGIVFCTALYWTVRWVIAGRRKI